MRFALGVLAVAALLVATDGRGATPRQTCAQYGTVAAGPYAVQTDEWNSSLPQCVAVAGTGFSVTKASFALPTNGPPAAYPSIYRGCHWGACTNASGLPLQVGRLRRAVSSWSTAQPAAGAYDVAYDLWTNSTPTTSGQPNGSEVMIWLASRGGVQPAGSQVATVRIDGPTWQVWTSRMGGWNEIAYRRTASTTRVRNLDVRAFIADSVRRGTTKPSWYLIDAEAGFEIWQGGPGLATRSFSFSAR